HPQTSPPRRSAPPLLDEEGNESDFALLAEEGRTRQCRGRVVLRRQTPPPRRFAPPLLDEEGNAFDFALLTRRAGRDRVADGWSAANLKPPHPVASRHPSSTRRGKR